MENPITLDDLGVPPTLGNHQVSCIFQHKFLKLPTGADIHGLELRDCGNFHSFLSDLKHMPRHLALWGSTQKDPEIETQWACCSEETF